MIHKKPPMTPLERTADWLMTGFTAAVLLAIFMKVLFF
jgi:hypothetical protein